MDRGQPWGPLTALAGYSVWGRKELDTTEQLNNTNHPLNYLCCTPVLFSS